MGYRSERGAQRGASVEKMKREGPRILLLPGDSQYGKPYLEQVRAMSVLRTDRRKRGTNAERRRIYFRVVPRQVRVSPRPMRSIGMEDARGCEQSQSQSNGHDPVAPHSVRC